MAMEVHRCFLLGVMALLVTIKPGGAGFTCLKCDSVALPRTCPYIDRCGPNELCGSCRWAYTFLICCIPLVLSLYYLRNGTSYGHEGTTRFLTAAGPVCYSCQSQIGADACNRIEQCGQDKICEIVSLNIPGAPPDLYTTGCQLPRACATNIVSDWYVGRKRRGTMCFGCCNGTLCNDGTDTDFECADMVVTATRVPLGGFPPSAAACTDRREGCDYFHCITPMYAEWSKYNCRKTCNYCTGVGGHSDIMSSSGSSSAATPTTSRYTTTIPTWPTPSTQSTTIEINPVTQLPQGAKSSGSDCTDVAVGCNPTLHCLDPTYAAWANINCRNTCKQCEGPTQWTVMMKGVAGVSAPDLYGLWASHNTLNSKIEHAPLVNTVFHGNYKSNISNNWNANHIQKVKVSIYAGDMEKAYIIFDARGVTNKFDWFTPNRILESSWRDLTNHTAATFQISRDSNTGWEFYARHGSSAAGTCDSTAWMIVSTDHSCHHAAGVKKPSFYYAPGNVASDWTHTTPAAGELFVIFAHSGSLLSIVVPSLGLIF